MLVKEGAMEEEATEGGPLEEVAAGIQVTLKGKKLGCSTETEEC